ncbi:MAG: 3-methyladenine glycosylase [Chlorobi bacterium]|nr:3-methyladenine glycosylase [Chlorobiota bacterium]
MSSVPPIRNNVRRRLPRSFYTRDARTVARELIGHILVTEIDGIRTTGRIIETEAYLGTEDHASHAYRGPTNRNRPMFQAGGHVYIYFIYGMYYCFNVVTGGEGRGEAVLIRGVEPLEGIDAMRDRRGKTPRRDIELTNGPGKLVIALGIGSGMNGADLMTDARVRIEKGEMLPDDEVVATPRIGITRAAEFPWRWIARSALKPRRST